VTDEPRAAGGPAPAGEPDVTARSPAPGATAGGKAGRAAGAGAADAADRAGTAPQAAGEDGLAGEAPAGDDTADGTGPQDPGEGGASGEAAGAGPPARNDSGAPGRPGPSATDVTATGDPAGEPDGRTDDAVDSAGTDEVEVDADLQAAADALEVDLELLLSERAQYLDAYRRAQADFENYRKQAQRRQDEAVVRALGAFVERLLPVLDSCDAALAHGASEVEPVLTALYGALSKEGLERIDPKGAAFDPTEAEAVVHEPGEGGEHVVAEVLRPGYRWRGKVLRPAMVKVTD
jgi:molecular chaperone GrpE